MRYENSQFYAAYPLQCLACNIKGLVRDNYASVYELIMLV